MLLEMEKEKFLSPLTLHREDLILIMSVWSFNSNLQEILNLSSIELDVQVELEKKESVLPYLIEKRTYKTFSESKKRLN